MCSRRDRRRRRRRNLPCCQGAAAGWLCQQDARTFFDKKMPLSFASERRQQPFSSLQRPTSADKCRRHAVGHCRRGAGHQRARTARLVVCARCQRRRLVISGALAGQSECVGALSWRCVCHGRRRARQRAREPSEALQSTCRLLLAE